MSVKSVFHGNVLLVGCGCIGQALLPFLGKHLRITPSQITVIAADANGETVANQYADSFKVDALHPDDYAGKLAKYLKKGDMLINLSVDVSSVALIEWCQSNEVLYLDTCVEPWEGGYHQSEIEKTTNAYLRQMALQLKGSTTAVIAHGANPGLVSHFAKRGLDLLGDRFGISGTAAQKAAKLGVRVIQIAEVDTQESDSLVLEKDTFYNTWSPAGFLSEAYQRGELGWGTHEQALPEGASLVEGLPYGAYLAKASCDCRVKSWTPLSKEQEAFLITHHEALSLSDHLSEEGYRPTVYYAYKPCALAESWLTSWSARHFAQPTRLQGLESSLTSGTDELGVLMLGDFGMFWIGSTLSLAEARTIAPYNTATTLQVVAGILGALSWMLQNPKEGVVEAEAMDSALVLEEAEPYLGKFWSTSVDNLWHLNKHTCRDISNFVIDRFLA